MNIFDLYADATNFDELSGLLTLGAQKHPAGLGASFLEKDIWVTEILRLLYDEGFVGDHSVAFKGGTALSKCWNVIERFSEDIDLSIHWADLAEADDEKEAWDKSVQSGNQRKRFRDQQTEKLTAWSGSLVERLNKRFDQYGIENLRAELEPDSHGEKIDIHFPRATANENQYQLDHVLLEFGGRNRGRPTVTKDISCYLSKIPDLHAVVFPKASVQAFNPEYILWEKLTALHQFSTQEKEPNPERLARHWYDVDCLLKNQIADPITSAQAKEDVVEMKSQRWSERGVDYQEVLQRKLVLVPSDANRLNSIAQDHEKAINGGMFFRRPNDFGSIITRLAKAQDKINSTEPS